MSHVVILPWYSEQEVDRYLRIVGRMGEFPAQQARWSFLLAASPQTAPSERLLEACASVAPTRMFRCPTEVYGYPEGPTAMFWDAMDYVAKNYPNDGGFGLWLESDMAPVKPDWLDRLDAEWHSAGNPWVMGCYIPQVYKSRLFRRRKLLLDAHINGGACYAKSFARRMPAAAREGVFDVQIYRYARQAGRVAATTQIDFSTVARARRDVQHPGKSLLHGYMQDKDQFIDACLAPVTEAERRRAMFNPVLDSVESLQRSLRVWRVRRGQRAMYENMLLAKRRNEIPRRAA